MDLITQRLGLTAATSIIQAAISKANALGVPCSVAIVDAGGHLVAFARQDGAMSGSAELAMNKAFTACIFNNDTAVLGRLAQPGADLYGIQHSHNGKVVVFGGGVPIHLDGIILGAVGVSGGSVSEDIAIVDAAVSEIKS